MAIIKLISDFDGVWTNQEIEAEYVWRYILTRVSGLTGDTVTAVEKIMQQCRNEMNKTPYEYGWYYEGEISAYYQEDPFGDNNAIFDYIEKNASTKSYSNFKQQLAKIKNAVEKKEKLSLSEFSNDCFVKSTTQFKLEGKLKPVETAGDVVKKLNGMGVEVIIASNSKTEKIEHLFRKAGQIVTNEKSIKRGRLHAIGDARKFVVEKNFKDLPATLEITKKYRVNLCRSNYYRILQKETPHYVIGDVFSLDLALPVYLRLNDKRFKDLKVIQKVQAHTPKWVKDYLLNPELKGIAFMVDSIDELPKLIKG